MAVQRIDPIVELFHDDQFNDISNRVRGGKTTGYGLDIDRGRSAEASSTDPTTLRLTINNKDGRFSPRNPNSELFGKIGRNTPIRARLGILHPGEVNGDINDTTDLVAPSVDAPTEEGVLFCAWVIADLQSIGTVAGMDSRSSISAPGPTPVRMRVNSQALSTSGPTGTRTATTSTPEEYVAASVVLHGTGMVVGASSSANNVDPLMELDSIAGDWLICFHAFSLNTGDVSPDEQPLVPLPDFPQDGGEGGWILVTQTPGVQVGADALAVRAWARRVHATGLQQVHLDQIPSLSTGTPGSAVATTIRVSGAGSPQIRASVEVSEWPVRWNIDENNVWVPIEGAGVLRRLDKASSPSVSALARTMAATSSTRIFGYWTLEDVGLGTTQVGSPVEGVPRARFQATGVRVGPVQREIDWSSNDSENPGIGTLPRIRSLFGQISTNADLAPFDPARVAMSHWTRGAVMDDEDHSTFTQARQFLRMSGSTVIKEWELTTETRAPDTLVPDGLVNVVLTARDEDGNDVDSVLFQTDFDPDWVNGAAILNDVGGNVDVTLYLNGEVVATDTIAGSLGTLLSTEFQGFSSSLNFVNVPVAAAVSIGHPIVMTDDLENLNSFIVLVHRAGRGYDGEHAGRRVQRLCQEGGIAFQPVGDLDDTVPMGAQRAMSLIDTIKECEKVDQGILYEPREFLGLAYRSIRSLYNQVTALAIDHDSCHLGHPLEPTDDDRLIQNDVTVDRTEGASAQAVEQVGPLSVQAPPDGVSRYPVQETVNVMSDAMLPDQAFWRLNLGTVDEERYPLVRVKNVAPPHCPDNPSISNQSAGLDLGDKLTIDNLPLWLPPETVEALMQGYTEHLDWYEWDLRFNTAPESPYHIAEVEHPLFQFLGSDASTLLLDMTIISTSVDLDLGAGPDWVHEGTDYDLFIGGEQMAVTGSFTANGTFPNRTQTLLVTRAVNGILKAHSLGTPVRLFHQARIGL